MADVTVETTSTIPSGTGISLTVYEDVGADGAGSATGSPDALGNPYDNEATQALSGGSESFTLSGFDGGTSRNDYWVKVELSGNSADVTTASPELSKLLVASTVPETVIIWETASEWDQGQSQTGAHHAQPATTDWAAADTVEKGYDPTQTGLEAYWPLDEDSGTTMTDVAASNDGTVTATLADIGVLGNDAYSMDRTNSEYAEATGVPGVNEAAFTAAFWFQFSSHDDFARLFQSSNRGVSLTPSPGWDLEFDGANETLRLVHWDSNTNATFTASSTSLSTGTWYFAVVKSDGDKNTSKCRLYDSSGLVEQWSVAGTRDTTATNNVQLMGGEDRYVTGTIDESLVFSRELSDSEADDLHAAVAGTSTFWTDTLEAGGGGPIRLSVDAHMPTDTSIDITLYEDVDNDGTGTNTGPTGTTYNNSVTQTVADGLNEWEFSDFFGGSGNKYWWEADFSKTGITEPDSYVQSVTVSPDLTITVPVETDTLQMRDRVVDVSGPATVSTATDSATMTDQAVTADTAQAVITPPVESSSMTDHEPDVIVPVVVDVTTTESATMTDNAIQQINIGSRVIFNDAETLTMTDHGVSVRVGGISLPLSTETMVMTDHDVSLPSAALKASPQTATLTMTDHDPTVVTKEFDADFRASLEALFDIVKDLEGEV